MQAFLQHQSTSESAPQVTGVTGPDAPRIAEKTMRLAEANGEVVNGKRGSQSHTDL